MTFQSTPSAWRVTGLGRRGGKAPDISIHTLRMEGDLVTDKITIQFIKFQSTPSAWRVTSSQFNTGFNSLISIHTLRMEGDTAPGTGKARCLYFNPHPPHGG